MMNRIFTLALAFAGVVAMAGQLSANIVHDEALDGDLSGVFAAPDLVDVNLGDNTFIGDMGLNGNSGATNDSDADYFTIVIESGEMLNSINVDSASGGDNSLFAYVAGSAFTGQDFGDIDGFVLFNEFSGNVLDDLLGGPGTLGPGTYSFWIQETNPVIINYSFTFNVSAIPEPASTALGTLALIGLMARRRR